ncbi:tetratricopeptide repeat protein [Nitrincola sp. MINF-07-Sa-05]|uniref:tetratricopeptide repeat protein n=1 Tax=Nitrincola salilacus TaxID=3400273 RepID=UPI003917F7FF
MKNSVRMALFGLTLSVSVAYASANTLNQIQQSIQSQDYTTAVTQLQPLVRDGDLDATHLLGTLYENGWGVEADEREAMRLYDVGARQGHLPSVTSLRAMRNKTYAIEFNRLLPLAEAGDGDAQNQVGVMYEFGNGVERNAELAFQWYQRAAEQMIVSAWHNLGRSYNFGTGTEQDFAEAEAWYLRAAERGYTDSLFFLGTLYATDHGGNNEHEPDIIAYAWMQNAAALGNQTAQPIAQRLLMKLDAEQTEAAEKLAERYRERYVAPYR